MSEARKPHSIQDFRKLADGIAASVDMIGEGEWTPQDQLLATAGGALRELVEQFDALRAAVMEAEGAMFATTHDGETHLCLPLTNWLPALEFIDRWTSNPATKSPSPERAPANDVGVEDAGGVPPGAVPDPASRPDNHWPWEFGPDSDPASRPEVSERGTHESPSSPKGRTAMGQLASPRSETSDPASRSTDA